MLVASAAFAFYTAGAMMLQGRFGRVVLPLGKPREVNMPGAIPVQPIQYEYGESGVKLGQWHGVQIVRDGWWQRATATTQAGEFRAMPVCPLARRVWPARLPWQCEQDRKVLE